MALLGSFIIDDTVTFYANAHTPTTGAAVDADADPGYRIYEDETGTPILTGTMAKLDDANTTGFYSEQITLSAANGFELGKSYCVRITIVVGGVTGTLIHTLQMGARVDTRLWNALATVALPLIPTTAGRTLDVSAGGEAGVDWANVGSPTTAVNLSATNIDVDQIVASVSGAVGSVTGAVGSVTGAVGSVTGAVGSVAAGGITAASIATGAIDADAIAADAVTEIQAGLATPTNITAGTITTVTNLTNAPTNGDLTATMKTSVNAEVVDALATDTYAEPGQGTPAATASLATKIGYLHKAWRNRTTQTSTQYSLFNDDGVTVDNKGTFSDDGTTADRGEITSGP